MPTDKRQQSIIDEIKDLQRRLNDLERYSGGGLPSPLDADTLEGNSLDDILDLIYPVGSIYISVVSTNPNTLFGFGTWVAFATGKTLVGIDGGDSDFDTVEETGGAKTHKHKGWGDADSGETAGDLRATVGSPTGDASRLGFVALSAINPNTGSGGETVTYRVGGSNLVGGGFSHFTKVLGYTSTKSSLQPYIVTYMWKRTA